MCGFRLGMLMSYATRAPRQWARIRTGRRDGPSGRLRLGHGSQESAAKVRVVTTREEGGMAEHSLFYFPYASLTDEQLPLLKVAALFFDKLFLLDPIAASWNSVGTTESARDGVRLLREAGILETVSPAAVLAKYDAPLAELVKRDMADRDFLALCDAQSRSSGQNRWTLSLAKVPEQLQTDEVMRRLLGPFAREVAGRAAHATEDYIEHRDALSYLPGVERGHPFERELDNRLAAFRDYTEGGEVYTEYRETEAGATEYRYAVPARTRRGDHAQPRTLRRAASRCRDAHHRRPVSQRGAEPEATPCQQ